MSCWDERMQRDGYGGGGGGRSMHGGITQQAVPHGPQHLAAGSLARLNGLQQRVGILHVAEHVHALHKSKAETSAGKEEGVEHRCNTSVHAPTQMKPARSRRGTGG